MNIMIAGASAALRDNVNKVLLVREPEGMNRFEEKGREDGARRDRE